MKKFAAIYFLRAASVLSLIAQNSLGTVRYCWPEQAQALKMIYRYRLSVRRDKWRIELTRNTIWNGARHSGRAWAACSNGPTGGFHHGHAAHLATCFSDFPKSRQMRLSTASRTMGLLHGRNTFKLSHDFRLLGYNFFLCVCTTVNKLELIEQID